MTDADLRRFAQQTLAHPKPRTVAVLADRADQLARELLRLLDERDQQKKAGS